jgi:DNA segregation ATPase FtsK/SpoIIIE, S-DNA-T family
MRRSDHHAPAAEALSTCSRCGHPATAARYCEMCGFDLTPDRPVLGIVDARAAREREAAWLAARQPSASAEPEPSFRSMAISDFVAYRAASAELLEKLGTYQRARLEAAEALIAARAEHAAAVEKLEILRADASASAHRLKPRNGHVPLASSTADEKRVRSAIAKVQSAFSTYGGFFERMQRRNQGRDAAAYLQAMDSVIQDEVEGLKQEAPPRFAAMVAAGERADADMRDTFHSYAAGILGYVRALGAPAMPLEDQSWKDVDEGAGRVQPVVRIADGYHWIAGAKHHMPVLAKVPGENVLVRSEWFPSRRKALVSSLLLRALNASPAGQLKLLLIDPTSLGEVFSPLLSISEHSEEVLHTKVWTSESDIRARLEEASDRVGLIIQKYLTDEYETLEDYNRAAGEVTEANVVIAVNDFPRGLDARSIELVSTLAEVGPRCGISLVLLQAAKLDDEQRKVCNDVASHVQVELTRWNTHEWFRHGSSHTMPGNVQMLRRDVTADIWLDMFDRTPTGVTVRAKTMDYVRARDRAWHAEEPGEWLPEIAEPVLQSVGKRFEEGAKVEVELDRVWQLYDAQRDGAPSGVAASESWWQGDATEAVEVPIGRQGSQGVATVRFDSQLSSSALLVGRPGSGKSNLLHVIICTLAALYPPEELELYLLDFKEAVEFAAYAGAALPQARVIALESDREFGVAVLRHLSAEIERRGRLFRGSVGEQSNLIDYRSQTGEPLPRIVLLIDEFHRLFDREDAIATEAAKHLDDLIRLGRGFGIHCLLASQTLLGMSSLGRHTLNQVAIRLALQCSEEDSRVLFSEENSAGALLTRPGEGIKNAGGGRVASNQPFQVPLLAESSRAALLRSVRERAASHGHEGTTRVYRRGVQAPWRVPAPEDRVEPPALRVGDAVALDPRCLYPFLRESGRNVLVVGRNEELAGAMLAAGVADLRLRHGDVDITLIDLMAVDGPLDTMAQALGIEVRRRREFEDCVRELADLVAAREPSRTVEDAPQVLVVNGLGKVRDLDVDDYSDEAQQLATTVQAVLRDGPEVGVHTVAWCDSVASLDRRIGRRLEREFGARVAFKMSSEDSLRLCDSEAAAGLHDHEALLVDIDRGWAQKFQPYERPDLSTFVSAGVADG